MSSISLDQISPKKNGTKHIGDLVIITALPNAAAPVDVIDAADEIDPSCLLSGLVPEHPPADTLVFSRVKVAGQQGSKNSVRKCKDDSQFLTFSVEEPSPDEIAKKVDYKHIGHAELEKKTGQATATSPSAQKIVDAYHRNRGKLGANEWSELYHKVLAILGKYDVRDVGGCYFVPVSKTGALSTEIRQLAVLFNRFGGNIMVLAQADTDAIQFAQPVTQGITKQIDELKTKIDDFGDKTRISTMESRIHDLSALKKQSRWVCGLLRTSAEAYEGRIDKLTEEVSQSLLTGLVDEAAAF